MINPLEFNDEIYKDLNIIGIVPSYAISNYGTVIDKYLGCQVCQYMTVDGYMRVSLKTTNGGKKWFLVHRLVMITFQPIENPELFEVDHLYGIKNDNRDTQLEWVSGVENIKRAVSMGLLDNNGEKSARSILTENIVRKICELLEKNIPTKDIVSIIGDVGVSDLRREIDGIRNKECWTSISKDYNINRDKNDRNMFTNEEVHSICKLLQEGYGYKHILKYLDFDVDNMNSKELEKYCNIISNIRIGKYYSDISKNYKTTNTSKSRYDQTLTNNQIHYICKKLEEGSDVESILISLGIDKSKMHKDEYYKYRKIIVGICKRKKFLNISNQYNF